ncbi:MAG: DnaD domain-containing protein [Moorellaceae bacterium]
MPAPNNFPTELLALLLEQGSVTIPNPLLQYYTRLGLSEIEVMIILHLLRWRQIEHNRFPSPEKLSQYLSVSGEEVKNILAGLIEKKILQVEPYYDPATGRWQNAFSLRNLWHKLTQIILAEEEASAAWKAQAAGAPEAAAAPEPTLGELYRTFEKEFGRPLSPFETNQIADWYHNSNLSSELIIEALKRAVLRGALNFRYIDSILRDWLRHNIRTVQEAIVYDERLLKQRPGKKKRLDTSNDDKYRELYRLEP